jgi:tripartite-type tricarboxylate transporter receptor subunit TctC
MNLRSILASLALAVLAGAAATPSQAYPDKPIRLIIPFGVGGNNDIVGREIATQLSGILGEQVLPENHGGAGGVIGTELASHAKPDGYTVLLTSSAFSIGPALYKLPYDPDTAFEPVGKVLDSTSALIVHKTVPADNVQELIALMKQKPGELIATATGVGGLGDLSAELFKAKAGVDFKIVMFKGGGEMIADMLGGHSQLFFTSLVQALPNLQSGDTKILGTAGAKRSALMPDVPTIIEQGVEGYQVANWWGLLVPAGTPKDAVDALDAAVKKMVESEDFIKWAHDQALDVDYMPAGAFSDFLAAEKVKWQETVDIAGIKLPQ